MVSWEVVFAKQALKDAKKLVASGLKPKAEDLLGVLAADPFQNPPPFADLVGDLQAPIRVASISSTGWCTRCSPK